MPTYEYQCEKGHEFTVKQSMKDEPISECPRFIMPGEDFQPQMCKAPCKRLISASSFILKGSGWAKDGYGSGTTGKNKRTPKRPKGSG